MLASAESGLSTEMASNGKLVGGHDDKPWDFGVGPRLKMFRQTHIVSVNEENKEVAF